MAAAFNLIRQSLPEARLLLIGEVGYPIEDWLVHPHAAVRTGFLDDDLVPAYLAACNICWVPLQDTPTNRGRLPIKINDYFAAGRPIVATRVGDMPAVIEGSGAGVICEPEPAALAQATVALLNYPVALAAMSLAAGDAAANTSWDRVAQQTEAFYQKLGNVV